MENFLPNDISAKYEIKLYQLAKWLEMPEDTMYKRNFRKTYFKKFELELIFKKIKELNIPEK